MTQKLFIELYNKNIVYRKMAPALYCPECKTGIAQAEVEGREFDTVFYDIQFSDANGAPLIISTTRPEFLPACVAVCINPADPRAEKLIGTMVTTPLGHTVPMFADSKALIDKGTGIVMVCSYGDETDLYWIKNYDLPERIIIDHNGNTINTGIEDMDGLSAKDARSLIVGYLKERGLICNEKSITHEIGTHERCHTPIEIIPVNQWFVKTLDFKEPILELSTKVKYYPKYFEKRFRHWVENLKWDWCISRERYFGIPIPVYYCKDCEEMFFPNERDFPVDPRYTFKMQKCPKCQSGNISPESNVLDTWFTASQTPDINGYWPMSMRTQAHDNIRVWSFYSMVMGVIKHGNVVPWHELMTTGHLLVKKGEKISKKSGGGAYDPYKIVSENSVDALRYAMSLARLGKDAYYEEENISRGRKLITKLINAYRFSIMNLSDYHYGDEKLTDDLHVIDKWLLSRYSEFLDNFNKKMKKYEGGLALQEFETFFWGDFCDTYLELAKNRLNSEDKSGKESAQYTLHTVMLEILKVASIYLPHIAEELYHSEFDGVDLLSDETAGFYYNMLKARSITTIPLKQFAYKSDLNLNNKIQQLNNVITEMRKLKIAKGLKLSIEIEKLKVSGKDIENLEEFEKELKYFSRARTVEFKEIVAQKDTTVELL